MSVCVRTRVTRVNHRRYVVPRTRQCLSSPAERHSGQTRRVRTRRVRGITASQV
jgi:hypothetical protein